MLELLQKNKGLAILVFGVATQLAGILMYAQSMISTINENSEILETLVTDVQALQGKVQNQSFTIDRLSYQNQFQNEALKETVSDLEQEISVIESLIMSR
mgnify:CR=1 FL=1|jgi:hypothetical protein